MLKRRGGVTLVLGHPLHAILTDFPLALWAVSVVWDVASLFEPEGPWRGLAFWTILAGLAFSVPTAGAGLVDFAGLPQRSAAEKTGWLHMGAMLTVIGLLTGSFVVRVMAGALPSGLELALALGLSWTGVLLMLAGAWLGGELVYRHGVGREAAEPFEERAGRR